MFASKESPASSPWRYLRQWQRGDPNSWTLFTVKLLDVQRLLSVTVTAQLSPYDRPDSSPLGWLLLFCCGLIHCVYTRIFLEPRGADVDRDCAFTAGFLRKKNQAVIPSTTLLTKAHLLQIFLRSFILTRHSTAEMLSVSQVIDRNAKSADRDQHALLLRVHHRIGALYAAPYHAGSSMGMLVTPWCPSLKVQLESY